MHTPLASTYASGPPLVQSLTRTLLHHTFCLQREGPAAPQRNLSGVSSLTVPLNGPPYCSSPAGECINLDRAVATFPNASFKACAVAWADPENSPLTYEFGTVSAATNEEVAMATRLTGNCYTFASLPTGPSTLYACAVDALNARTCQEVRLELTAAPRLHQCLNSSTTLLV